MISGLFDFKTHFYDCDTNSYNFVLDDRFQGSLQAFAQREGMRKLKAILATDGIWTGKLLITLKIGLIVKCMSCIWLFLLTYVCFACKICLFSPELIVLQNVFIARFFFKFCMKRLFNLSNFSLKKQTTSVFLLKRKKNG